MNTQAFTHAKNFTKAVLAAVAAISAIGSVAHAEWTVDFSRRAKITRDADLFSSGRALEESSRAPASVKTDDSVPPGRVAERVIEANDETAQAKGMFDSLFEAGETVQDIVIMQTERGFVPATVRVRKNGRYKISVVNVNEKEKNVSFILDGFSEHHATYYGKIKSFLLEPKKEGTYSFQSPETSAEGKLVVFSPQISLRIPASASADGSAK